MARDEVFGIFSGQYSDWECHGYFPDAESAYRYCEMRNQTAKWERFYVMPLKRIACDFGDCKRKKFEFRVPLNGKDGAYKPFEAEPEVEYTDHAASRLDVNRYGAVFAYVVMEKYDPVRAQEIATELAEEHKLDIAEVLVDIKDGRSYRNMAVKTVWEGTVG